jgi:hypothetical protein
VKKPVLFMVKLGSFAMGLAGARCRRNEGKPINSMANRFFRARILCGTGAIVAACLVAVLTLAPVPCAFGQTSYEMTVHNNFGPGEFYNATPTTAQIWLLTDFQFDYLASGVWTVGNPTAGSPVVINLSTISQGKMRIYRSTGASRMYAILSDTQPTAQIPYPSTTQPNNYIEWTFNASGTPGTLDLSWIDRWDFLTRLEVSNLPSSAPTMVYGSKKGQSTAAVGRAMAGYASQPQYAWLGTAPGGFSQALSFPGATNPISWVTLNRSGPSGFASRIPSLKSALDKVIATAATSPDWSGYTAGIGPNWTKAGFRVGTPEAMGNPAGDATYAKNGWTAYVNFTKDESGSYTMSLTDFTLYTIPVGAPSATAVWSAVNDDNGAVYKVGAVYSVTQAQELLDCIWTSSWNNLSTTPTWITNINQGGGNATNIMYAIYNALASGVIYLDSFVNNTQLPFWQGYEPRISGVTNYNFEILTAGAPVAGGLAGLLNGQDMINLLNNQATANLLVNPYFLVLLSTQEVTPAYLYPSQDVWGFNGVAGASPVLGLQTGPLNGTAFGDNATFDWYLGGGRNGSIPASLMLLLLN